jgi:hypothetical protein
MRRSLLAAAAALLIAACGSGGAQPAPDLAVAAAPDLSPAICTLGGSDCPNGDDCSAWFTAGDGSTRPTCRPLGTAGVGMKCAQTGCAAGLVCVGPAGLESCRIVCDSVSHRCPVGPCNDVNRQGAPTPYIGYCG